MGLCHSVQNPNAPRKTPSTGQSKEKFIHNKSVTEDYTKIGESLIIHFYPKNGKKKTLNPKL